MNERPTHLLHGTGQAGIRAQRLGRRRVLTGGAALSFGALLATAGRAPGAVVAAPSGAGLTGWSTGTFAGELIVSLAQAWREPRSAPAGGTGDLLVEVSRFLQLRGRVTLTVSEAGAAWVVGGTAEATWSMHTLTAYADGRRREEVRHGRLDGGELVLDAAGAETGAPRLLWQGATWRPAAFPSYTTTMYGPDGRPEGRHGDGMVATRPADPLLLTVAWRSPDLIVAGIDAESVRPPSTEYGGPEASPGAQATDLRRTAVGTIALLREPRVPAPAVATAPRRMS